MATNQNTDKPAKIKLKSVFDHVKEIRQSQRPDYYITLSDGDKKSFNHFMILRALSMDSELIENMAELYAVHDKIPSPQFYTLLIAIIPKSTRYYPWVKSKRLKHNKQMLKYIADRFKIPTYQANDYVNLYLRTELGQAELVSILQSYGLSETEINELFEEEKYEEK